MDLLNKAVQPIRQLMKSDFDFSNMNDYEFDVEGKYDAQN